MNEYIVKYWFGKTLEEIYVQAHNEEQAKTIARIQVQSTHHNRIKFEIISICKKGEKDIFMENIDKYISSEILDKKTES